MPGELGQILVEVEQEGAQNIEGPGEAPAVPDFRGKKGGKGAGGSLDGILGALAGIAELLLGIGSALSAGTTALLAIAGLLLMMEPIQKTLNGMMDVLKAFLIPLASVIIGIMAIAMRALVKFLPLWLAFWKKIGKLIQQYINTTISIWSTIISVISQLPKLIATKLKSILKNALIKQLKGALASVIPGGGLFKTGANLFGGVPKVLPGVGGENNLGQVVQKITKDINVNFRGYGLDEIVNRVTERVKATLNIK